MVTSTNYQLRLNTDVDYADTFLYVDFFFVFFFQCLFINYLNFSLVFFKINFDDLYFRSNIVNILQSIYVFFEKRLLFVVFCFDSDELLDYKYFVDLNFISENIKDKNSIDILIVFDDSYVLDNELFFSKLVKEFYNYMFVKFSNVSLLIKKVFEVDFFVDYINYIFVFSFFFLEAVNENLFNVCFSSPVFNNFFMKLNCMNYKNMNFGVFFNNNVLFVKDILDNVVLQVVKCIIDFHGLIKLNCDGMVFLKIRDTISSYFDVLNFKSFFVDIVLDGLVNFKVDFIYDFCLYYINDLWNIVYIRLLNNNYKFFKSNCIEYSDSLIFHDGDKFNCIFKDRFYNLIMSDFLSDDIILDCNFNKVFDIFFIDNIEKIIFFENFMNRFNYLLRFDPSYYNTWLVLDDNLKSYAYPSFIEEIFNIHSIF